MQNSVNGSFPMGARGFKGKSASGNSGRALRCLRERTNNQLLSERWALREAPWPHDCVRHPTLPEQVLACMTERH